MTGVIDKINRPSLLRWAIGFLLGTYFSTSKASPNDSKTVIIVIIVIVVGEEMRVQHDDGIIAQRNFFGIFFMENGSGAVAGLFVTTLGAFTGTLRANGWTANLAYVIFGLGYALLLFLKRGARQ